MADRRLLERWRASDPDNRVVVWLSEHVEHGLPTVAELVGLLGRGRVSAIRTTGVFNLRLWWLMHRRALEDFPRLRGAHRVHHLAWGVVGVAAATGSTDRLPAYGRGGHRPTGMTAATAVDVLIVSYNSRDDLARCLGSLDRHCPGGARARLQVRILDNASSDGSAEVVVASFPHVVLARSDRNLGFASATNRLVAASNADYVLLLNPDTALTEEIVTPLLRVLESDPRIAVVGRTHLSGWLSAAVVRGLPSLRYELARNLRGTKADRLLRPLIDLEATIAATRELHLPAGPNLGRSSPCGPPAGSCAPRRAPLRALRRAFHDLRRGRGSLPAPR